MKKYLLILACACFAFAACDELMSGGNENGSENTETPSLDQLPDIGGGNKPTEELTPSQQQAKFQSVGQELLEEFPAEKFQNLADIAEAFDETYGYGDYDMSALEEWAENSANVSYSHNHQDRWENDGVGFCKTNTLILLSNYNGLFTFGASKVIVSPYDGTKAVFTVNGKTYEAEITSRGKVTNAYFEYNSHYETQESYDTNNDGIINKDDWYSWTNETRVTLGVPEEINISFTENGTPLATVNAKFSINMTSDEFQFSTDAFAVEYSAVINGYELKMSKTGYDASSSKAQSMITLSNGSETLLTYIMSADLHLKTETSSGADDQSSWTVKEVVVKKFENFNVALDILGQIQVKGTCKDLIKVIDEVNAIFEALSDYDWETGDAKSVDEVAAQNHTNELNNLIDLGVYYDKGSNKQAGIEFEYYYEEIHDSDGDYDYILHSRDLYPIIVFNDGSKNRIEDFFTEQAFSKLIDSVEEFAESYETVFGYFI